MYLHIGENKLIKEEDIIGIFDSDTSTVSKITRKLLSEAQKNGTLETIGLFPKSFIVVTENKTDKIYFSQLSSKTLAQRAETDDLIERKL